MIEHTLSLLADVILKHGEVVENIKKVDENSAVVGLLNTMYWAAGITAVIIIIIAGLFYVLSAGNEKHTKQAREAIIYAGVGLVVIMAAFAITGWIAGRF